MTYRTMGQPFGPDTEHGTTTAPPRAPVPPGTALPETLPEPPRGCLFALSQPPLMGFLALIALLVGGAAVHDLFLL
ncbi:hypothetical protein [Streptomyces sp. NPDC005438]|uniref:hypothetical protein n=1 Tax=Streptomyces sp. NPDC005438 TaxID=3156880 RepID=UPI0033AA3F0F